MTHDCECGCERPVRLDHHRFASNQCVGRWLHRTYQSSVAQPRSSEVKERISTGLRKGWETRKVSPQFQAAARENLRKGRQELYLTAHTVYGPDWKQAKQAVRERDTGCQVCGTLEGTLVVHHLDYAKQNCQLENLKLLCQSCHRTGHHRAAWPVWLGNPNQWSLIAT
jgi:5-methylcytosine-specific restriction endonuclease McrA